MIQCLRARIAKKRRYEAIGGELGFVCPRPSRFPKAFRARIQRLPTMDGFVPSLVRAQNAE